MGTVNIPLWKDQRLNEENGWQTWAKQVKLCFWGEAQIRMLEQRPMQVAGDADGCTLASPRARCQKHQGSHHEVVLGTWEVPVTPASSAFRHAGSKGGIRRAQLLSVTVPPLWGLCRQTLRREGEETVRSPLQPCL